MSIPIVMAVLSLLLDQPINRWANLIAAVGLFVFQRHRAADLSGRL
jgi:hypothetical protein